MKPLAEQHEEAERPSSPELSASALLLPVRRAPSIRGRRRSSEALRVLLGTGGKRCGDSERRPGALGTSRPEAKMAHDPRLKEEIFKLWSSPDIVHDEEAVRVRDASIHHNSDVRAGQEIPYDNIAGPVV